MLKQELNENEITLETSQDLVVKVLSKTLDMTKLTSEKGSDSNYINLSHSTKIHIIPFYLVEMATLTRENNKTVITILTNSDVDALIAKYEKLEAELEASKREKLAKVSN